MVSLLTTTTRRFSSSFFKASNSFIINRIHGGVYDVKINHPENQNSFTLQLWKDLKNLFDHLSELSECRSIVLSGNGVSFCSGINLKTGISTLFDVMNNEVLDVARKSRAIRSFIKTAQDGFTSIEKCQKPVIASIHGYCIGAGTSLASCCDIRYSTSTSLFSIKEVDIGISADVGILQRMHYLTGNDSWARELAYTGRDFLGSEALKYGFVSRTFDSKEDCIEASFDLAKCIASKSPVAVQGTKLALNFSQNHSVDESLEWHRTWAQSQLQTEDIISCASARSKKIEPHFNDA